MSKLKAVSIPPKAAKLTPIIFVMFAVFCGNDMKYDKFKSLNQIDLCALVKNFKKCFNSQR